MAESMETAGGGKITIYEMRLHHRIIPILQVISEDEGTVSMTALDENDLDRLIKAATLVKRRVYE